MFELNQSVNRIIVKRNTTFSVIGIVVIVLAIILFRVLLGFLPAEEKYTFADVLRFIFVFIFISFVFGCGMYELITNSKKITINDDGVLCEYWFTKKFIDWSDVKDWGLSYCCQTRWEGDTYYLYFSTEVHPTKSYCKKKLKGKMIKTFVFRNDYTEAVNKIVPFCCQRTNIEPFVGKCKHHFA